MSRTAADELREMRDEGSRMIRLRQTHPSRGALADANARAGALRVSTDFLWSSNK